MGRFPISTQAVTTVLVVGIALLWGLTADWCVWWRVGTAAVALIAVCFLAIREVNRARIKDRELREAFDQVKESAREGTEETRSEVTVEVRRLRWDMLSNFNEVRLLQERALEALDPTYERPNRVHLKASGGFGPITGPARLCVTRPTKLQRLRLQLMYLLRWIWGTHDAPPAEG